MSVPHLASAVHPQHGDPHDKAAHGALADAMMEEGVPGSNIVVQHARQLGDEALNWTRGFNAGTMLPVFYSRMTPAFALHGPEETGQIPMRTETQPPGAPKVYERPAHILENNATPWRFPRVVVHHSVENAHGGKTHFIAEANADNVDHLAHDLDPVTAQLLRNHVGTHTKPSGEPFHLARPEEEKKRGETIDAKGNTVGVNQWTGNALKPDKNAPLKTEVVPENHWADGIVHPGVYPGTNNVSPTADAAWHERSAVHKALERLEPGRAFGQADVGEHVQMIKKIMQTNAGKTALAGPIENYQKGAAVLPQITGKGAGVLRGSGIDSRPTGPVLDRLAQLVHPLAEAAHRAIKFRNAKEAGPVSKPLPFDPNAGPAYEVVDPKDVNIPEDLPIDLPTPSSALRKIKVVSDDKEAAVKARAEKESQKNTIAAAKANKDPDAIPVVASAKPLGWKPPAEHRFAAIHRLLQTGATPEQIKAHLTDVNGHALTKRQAAASLVAYLRAETARRAQEALRAASESPVKLARPPFQAEINPRDLSGGAYPKESGGFGTQGKPNLDAHKSTSFSIDPQIAGTSLAYHLRQIADHYGGNGSKEEQPNPNTVHSTAKRDSVIASLAEHALAGKAPVGTGGDVYAALGQALKSAGHPLSNAYNWDRMSNGLARDRWVEEEVSKVLKPDALKKYQGRQDWLWDHVHRSVRNGTPMGTALLDHLRNQMGVGAKTYLFDTKQKQGDQALLDAIHRIADRHLDREYLKAVTKDRQRGPSHTEGDPLYWRSVMAASHGKKRDAADPTRKHLRY